MNLLIQFRFDSFEEFMVEYAENLSEGGIFVHAEVPRRVGSMIYLQFSLKDGTRLIEGLGRVVHVSPPGSATSGMGVEFVSVDPESMELIRAIIEERVKKGLIVS